MKKIQPKEIWKTVGLSNLHIAIIENKDINYIKNLVMSGEDPNNTDNNLRTPLHYACSKAKPNLKIIKLLLNKGANPDLQDEDGWTALLVTGSKKCPSLDIIKLLLKYNSNINIKNRYKWTPVDYLLKRENRDQKILGFLSNRFIN